MFLVAIIQIGEIALPLRTNAEVVNEGVVVFDGLNELSAFNSISSISTTEEKVEQYFADIPILIDVARCESRFRQFDSTGSPLRGIENPADVGVMQINETYHLDTANRLGINIYTLEGNLKYGRYLYETFGSAPWVHSSKCWGTNREVALR